MTPMMPNPFITDSVDVLPPTLAEPAVAHLPGKGSAAAEPIQSSCGGENAHQSRERCADNNPAFSKAVEVASDPHETAAAGSGRAVAAGLRHNPITQAVEVRDDPEQLLRFAGQRSHQPTLRSGSASRRLELPRFAPDFHAIWHDMHDPDAPRAPRPRLDPVWGDASPTFLKMVR